MAGIFVTGGCKSGKSSFAQSIAEKMGPERIYVATGKPTDDEMVERIKKHREERGEGWETIETDTDIISPVKEFKNKVIMIDCITAWITNFLMADISDDEIINSSIELGKFIKKSECKIVTVSNEVGYGIVPTNSLARRFRDIAGVVNQKIAEYSDNLILVVSGIPMNIKGDYNLI